MWREKPLRGVDDEIYGIHTGTDWEASIRVSDIAASLEALTTRSQPGEDAVERNKVLAGEVLAVHDALGFIEDFEVREPDLHLTRSDCRAILRDARAALNAAALPVEGVQATDGECQRLRSALEKAREAIASLPQDGLGMAQIAFGGPDDIYPIRDELLLEIDAALKDQSA
jgi:hypothetical protein